MGKMKPSRVQKIEKGHSNSLQIHTSLLQKEESSRLLAPTVDRRSNNRTFSGKDSKVYNADFSRVWGNVLYFKPSKSGQPKLLGNDTCVVRPEMDMKSVTSQGPCQACLPWLSNPKCLWPPPQSSVAIVVLFGEKQQLSLPWPFLPQQCPFILSSRESHRAQHVFATHCE